MLQFLPKFKIMSCRRMLNVSFCADFFYWRCLNNNIELQDLLDKLKEYNSSEIKIVKEAYEYAAKLHSDQTK